MFFNDLHNKKQQIIFTVNQYGGSDVQVFGSVARGEDKNDSDVDLLISFPLEYDLFTQRIPLQEALTDILGRNVDLVVKHELNRHIRSDILMEARDL